MHVDKQGPMRLVFSGGVLGGRRGGGGRGAFRSEIPVTQHDMCRHVAAQRQRHPPTHHAMAHSPLSPYPCHEEHEAGAEEAFRRHPTL